ncbi:hypothetical protein E2562_029876 [Oryza meyeriana var. granulata]|uniref:Uncharacterized protein n=1 Tax=Oryza meyeriana var. granulata TaxID=110450 RepID=A0A6G1ER80_9ORYZ|nr:hypothetical protein E2562_029876 [Oryza meyeriana var. granulata]
MRQTGYLHSPAHVYLHKPLLRLELADEQRTTQRWQRHFVAGDESAGSATVLNTLLHLDGFGLAFPMHPTPKS